LTVPFLLHAASAANAFPAVSADAGAANAASGLRGYGSIPRIRNSVASRPRAQSRPAGCATIFPTDRFELDLKNSGNPLIPYLQPLMRVAQHLRRRAITGQIAAAIERRRKA